MDRWDMQVGSHLLVDDRRTRSKSIAGTVDHGQRLVIDADEINRGHGLVGCIGNHSRDRFAIVTHFASGQGRRVAKVNTQPYREICPSEHGTHAGRSFRRGSIDADDSRVRVGAGEKRCVQAPWRM